MRNIVRATSIFGMLFALVASVAAQVDVSLELEQEKVLLYEPLPAHVRIVNDTSETIRLGGDQPNAYLDFDIVDNNDRGARKREGRSVVSKPQVIEPWQTETVTVDIASVYNISKAVPHRVVCYLKWDGSSYSSNRKSIQVENGMLIDSKTISLSENGDEKRKFMLLFLHRERKSKLFLRIDNVEKSICYGVYKLGDYIRISKAQMMADGQGRMHILHQSGPGRFTYHRISRQATPDEKKFYSGFSGDIHLQRMSDGKVRLIGGKEYEGDSYSRQYQYERNRLLE